MKNSNMKTFSNIIFLRSTIGLMLLILYALQIPSIRCSKAGIKILDDTLGFDWMGTMQGS
jgi:hypothetical protein